MKFSITPVGDPLKLMAREILAAEKAATLGTRRAGKGLQRDWRTQVRAALGYRLAGALRMRSYPERGDSINAASLVYAPSKRSTRRAYPTSGGTAAEVLAAHDRGALIRSDDGFFLAIPLGKAAKMRGADGQGRGDQTRITPGGWERRTGRRLSFVYRKGKPSLLVDEGEKAPGNVMLWRGPKKGYSSARRMPSRKKKPVAVFMLLPQVRLKKKLDLDRDTRKWESALPGEILRAWKSVK